MAQGCYVLKLDLHVTQACRALVATQTKLQILLRPF